MKRSAIENLFGAVLTLIAAMLTILVGVFIHGLLWKGAVPVIPGLENLQGPAGEAARQVVSSSVLLPLILMSLWLSISRASAHYIPDWGPFWYVDFVPSIGLFLFLLLVVPASIWNASIPMPVVVGFGIYGAFLFASFFDVVFNGRHRVEHVNAPAALRTNNEVVRGGSVESGESGKNISGPITIQHVDNLVIADSDQRVRIMGQPLALVKSA